MDSNVSALFIITTSSGLPIYRQIMDQVQRLIISEHLKPGDELPSVRQVAQDLEVNPMTISKAYSLLEAQGVLTRLRGKGMIISDNQRDTGSKGAKFKTIRPILEEAAAQARQLDLSKAEMLQFFSDILEERHV